jgi:NADH dehydrogenase
MFGKTISRPARIVIVGAGFGGIYAYLSLHRRFHKRFQTEVTLVNDGDRFIFTPLIHEVATGTLLPSGVMESLRTLPQCCIDDFIDGRATAVDFNKKILRVERNMLNHVQPHGRAPRNDLLEVPYDYLVLALGSETNFFGVPGARELALELKNLNDAKRIKNRVIESFERAERMDDPKEQKATLRFVIVGGGPTGVELAGELGDFITGELAGAFPRLAPLASIVIVERDAHLVGKVDPWFGKRAVRVLERKADIYIMTETSVVEVTPNGVKTDKGMVHAHTVIWTAGVRAREIAIAAEQSVELDERSRRIKVNEQLQIPGYPDVFVVGDMAWVYDAENHQPYPMRAQFAVREGKTVGRNIGHMMYGESLEAFRWKEKGLIISLGKGGAMAEIYGIRFSGFFAWLIYRVAYLGALIGWRARMRTALEWVLNPFLPRDISKL